MAPKKTLNAITIERRIQPLFQPFNEIKGLHIAYNVYMHHVFFSPNAVKCKKNNVHHKKSQTAPNANSFPAKNGREENKIDSMQIYSLYSLNWAGNQSFLTAGEESSRPPPPPLSILLSISHLSTVFLSFLSFLCTYGRKIPFFLLFCALWHFQ